jgi:hypothetical protein
MKMKTQKEADIIQLSKYPIGYPIMKNVENIPKA